MFRGVLALMLLSTSAFGGDRLSGYTYESDLLEAGKGEVEADLAYRFLRTTTYEQADMRTGYARGVNSWLEAQVLLDFSIITPDTGQGSAIGLVTGLLKAKLMDGHKDPLGLGAQLSVSGGTFGHLELRAILDKWFGNFLIALNALWSETFIGPDVAPTRLEQSLNLAYQLPNRLSIGLEVRNRSGWNDHAVYLGDAVYMGPTLSMHFKRLWVATSLLMQVGAFKAKAQQGNGEPNEVIDNERFNLRLALGADLD
ncbi:MAG: hypothetical protein QM723_26370 [Myxococcaceae bacterium]